MFLVCFSVHINIDSNNGSYKILQSHVYNAVNKFMREVRNTWSEAPCILIGTKYDTRKDPSLRANRRFLPHVYGKYIARETGCLAYMETSSAISYNLEVLKQAVLCAEKYNRCQAPKQKKCTLM